MSQTEKSSDSKSSNEKSDNSSVADVEYQLVRQLKNRHIAMIRRVETSLVLGQIHPNHIFCSAVSEALLEQVR